MNCDQAAGILRQFLDREIDSALVRDIQTHLDICRECRGYARFERALQDIVQKVMVQNGANPQIKQRIMKAIGEFDHDN